MDASYFYWMDVADCLKGVGVILSILFGIGFIVMFCIANGDDDAWPIVRRIGIALAISVCMAVFVPCARTIAAMYVIPRIVNNEKINTIGDEAYDLAIEWLRALKPDKSDKEKVAK